MNDHERGAALLDSIEENVGKIRQRVDGNWRGVESLDPLCERLQQAESLLADIQEAIAPAADSVAEACAEATDTLPAESRRASQASRDGQDARAEAQRYRSGGPQKATDWKSLLIAGAVVAGFMMFVAAADGMGTSDNILFVGLLTTAVFGGAGWLAGAKAMQHMSLVPAVVAGFVAWVVLAGFLSGIGIGAPSASASFAAMFGAGAWYSSRTNAPPRA